MKKHISNILLVLVFLVGLSLLLYPTFADWWNSFHQSRAIDSYNEAMSTLAPEDYTAYFDAADDYNVRLRDISFPLMNHDQLPGYNELLDVAGTGIIGYINIPKINIELPIYHGTSDGVLAVAVGHLEGSSLPVGGPGTHAVLSAHRGLPSARLFTDLDQLMEGDIFQITVLNRLLTYQVDQILIVEPQMVDDLSIVEGKDYCTLITCTPYGINTHRMLVRGRRVENPEEELIVHVTADAVQIEPIIIAPIIATPMLILLVLFVIFRPKRKRNRRKKRQSKGGGL